MHPTKNLNVGIKSLTIIDSSELLILISIFKTIHSILLKHIHLRTDPRNVKIFMVNIIKVIRNICKATHSPALNLSYSPQSNVFKLASNEIYKGGGRKKVLHALPHKITIHLII